MTSGKAQKKRTKLSIRRKLFIALILVSILPVLLISFLSMYTLNSALYRQIIENGHSSSGNIKDRLELAVKDYSGMFYDFEVNSEFKADITSWCDKNPLDYSKQWELISALNTTINLDSSINSIEVCNLCNGQVLDAKRTGAQLINDGSGFNIWAARDPSLQTNSVFERSGNEILIMHQMNSFDNGKALAVIVMHIRYSAFESMLERTLSSNLNSLFLFNDSNELILSITGEAKSGLTQDITSQLDSIRESENQEPYKISGQYLFNEPISDNKLFLIQAVPKTIIVNATYSTIKTGILVGGLCIVVALLMSIILSRIISNPIMNLAETMKTLTLSNFPAEIDIKREDEIGFLQKSFNSMIARNQELINREYISKLEKVHAQIYALQAQINPHFLYNTLQAIGGMALRKGVPNIYAMTVALSDIMRYSLDFTKELVPISEELKYLESYLFIQSQRFVSRLEIKVNIPEELRDLLIPKLILQPIIENSLEHGMEDKDGKLTLEIAANRAAQDGILLSIHDNGVGIAEDKLLMIQNELNDFDKIWESSNHIGLKNVNMRIRLTYQEGCRVNIFSQEGFGTTVEILIKAVKEANHEI